MTARLRGREARRLLREKLVERRREWGLRRPADPAARDGCRISRSRRRRGGPDHGAQRLDLGVERGELGLGLGTPGRGIRHPVVELLARILESQRVPVDLLREVLGHLFARRRPRRRPAARAHPRPDRRSASLPSTGAKPRSLRSALPSSAPKTSSRSRAHSRGVVRTCARPADACACARARLLGLLDAVGLGEQHAVAHVEDLVELRADDLGALVRVQCAGESARRAGGDPAPRPVGHTRRASRRENAKNAPS